MKKSKIIRIIALILIGGALLMLMFFSTMKGSSNEEKVWDARTTIGRMEAKNYYVMYTDLACPYCDVFSRAIMDNEEEFERDYIEGKDILFEVRVTDFLYEYGERRAGLSRWGATGAYCATQEDKFWDYYHQALKSLWEDYHSKGIGSSKTAPAIEGMTKDYVVKIGEKVGLDGEKMSDCMDAGETIEAIEKATAKAAKVADGMPYFSFNSFKTSGFSDDWGFDYVKRYLDAGLKK